MFSLGQDRFNQQVDEMLEMARMLYTNQFGQQQQQQDDFSYSGHNPPCNHVYDQEWMDYPNPNWSNPSIQNQWEYDQWSYNQWEYDQWGYNQASDQTYASPPQETFYDLPFPIPTQTQYLDTSYFPPSPQILEPTEPPSQNLNAALQEMMEMMQEMQNDINQLKISQQQASVVLPEAQQDPKKGDEQLPSPTATTKAPEQGPNVEQSHILATIPSHTKVALTQGEVHSEFYKEMFEEELDKENKLVKEYRMVEESLEKEFKESIEIPKVLDNNLVLKVYEHAGVQLSEFQGPRLKLSFPPTPIFSDKEEDMIFRKSSFKHLNKSQYIWSNKRPLLPIRKDLYPPPFFDDG